MTYLVEIVWQYLNKDFLGIANTMGNDTMARRLRQVSTRANRFPVQIPIRYRLPQSPEWIESQTENVSHTGVLFRTKSILKPTTIVDVRLEFPPTNGDGTHAEVVCKCEVIRVDQTRGRKTSRGLAVAIRNYRFTRKQEPN